VVLGGGLGAAAVRALERVPAVSPWFQYPVAAARLGDEAGVIGAALAARP
jgi:glucokinase